MFNESLEIDDKIKSIKPEEKHEDDLKDNINVD